MGIADNLAAIHERIARAAQRAERNSGKVRLMAVTKRVSAVRIIEAHEAGQFLFGENRVQEFAGKQAALTQLGGAEFHLIGHLQSNKAGKAVELFHSIDSLDSVNLGERLNAAAEKLGKTLEVLIEINIGGEDAKAGVALDSPELDRIFAAACAWPNLHIQGFMTVPPFTEDPEGARPYFRRLRELRDRVAARNLPSVRLDELSMGMSHDFEVAIEEGSTCVRVGTAIFGERGK